MNLLPRHLQKALALYTRQTLRNSYAKNQLEHHFDSETSQTVNGLVLLKTRSKWQAEESILRMKVKVDNRLMQSQSGFSLRNNKNDIENSVARQVENIK